MDLVDVADKDKNGKIDYEEWQIMGKTLHWLVLGTHSISVDRIKSRIPMAEDHVTKVCLLVTFPINSAAGVV